MLTKETRKHIDNARDILVGQLPLPSDQIELITIALIYKFMDDIDERTKKLGGQPSFFKNGLTELSWRKIISNELSADERVAKFIAAMEGVAKAEHIQELFKSIFKNTFLKFRDGRILKMFMDEVNYFEYSHSEELGNAFEYLLNSMGTQAENGQFRTPRNIIDFITEVVDPQKEDTILDPACGTAGFLISAYKHVLYRNTKGYGDYSSVLRNYDIDEDEVRWGDELSQDEMQQITENIVGYDITPLMGRLSRVNMYLHHFANPQIHEYDSINNDNRWKEKYDCILANPPFMSPRGSALPHEKFRIRATRTEVLFADYILEHLTPNGKAGFIVPEGIIFQNNGDYVELRKWVIEEAGLWAVVSLPAMIFQPYSGVKTSILFIDRKLARERDSIILMKVENDGFSLNTNRTPVDKNNLPAALRLLTAYKRDPKATALTGDDDAKAIKFSVLPRVEFERLDSYRAATTGWSACQRAFVRLKQAEAAYTEKKNEKLDEKQRKKFEDKWQRHKEAFHSETHYHKGGLPESEEELKQWYETYVKAMCVAYGSDPKKPIAHTNGGPYLSDYLKEKLDNEREYNLSLDKYTNAIRPESRFPLVKLGDMCEVLDSLRKPVASKDRKSGPFPYYGAMGIVDYIDEFIFDERLLLVAEDGGKWTAGELKAFVAEGRYWVNNHVHVLRVKKDQVVDSFLMYCLNNVSLQEHITGAVVPKLTQGALTSIEFPLPPIDIQQRLAAEIDSYQKVIDGCTAVIENYKPSIKIDESWPRVKLGDVCRTISNGRTVPPRDRKDAGKYRVYGGNGILCFTDNMDLLVEANIVVGRVGAYCGNSYLITEKLIRVSDNAIWISLKEGTNPAFVNHILQSIDIRGSAKGGGQPYISQDTLNNIDIPLPNIERQNQVEERLMKEAGAVKACELLKQTMESRIKEVIDGVWGANTIAEAELEIAQEPYYRA